MERNLLLKGASLSTDRGILPQGDVLVAGGVIRAVAETIIETVKYKMEHLTGIKVKRVNVSVEDIRV